MASLIFTYKMKIGFTLLCWCLPLLLFPALIVEALGTEAEIVTVLLRLLGWAYLALCVGYFIGMKKAYKGEYHEAPIFAGIASNSGVSLLLTWMALRYVDVESQTSLFVFLLVSATGAGYVTLQLVRHAYRLKMQPQETQKGV